MNGITGAAKLTVNEQNAIKLAGFNNKANEAWYVPSSSNAPNIAGIGGMRRLMAEKHYYQVEFVNNDTTGLIEYVLIQY